MYTHTCMHMLFVWLNKKSYSSKAFKVFIGVTTTCKERALVVSRELWQPSNRRTSMTSLETTECALTIDRL